MKRAAKPRPAKGGAGRGAARPAGRPRSFDVDRALDRALLVFWKKGFEGASVSDLTRAMGINRPSLYGAFGDKQRLFRLALDRYAQGPGAYFARALVLPTAREVARAILTGTAELVSNPGHPHGCLWVQGALACSRDADPVRRAAAARRCGAEQTLRARFERAIKEHDLPPSADPAALARLVMAVNAGMAVLATGGTNGGDLRTLAETAVQLIPQPRETRRGSIVG